MSQFSKDMHVSTDVAHIVLFHPDDLAHAAEWPIAWYSEPFVYPSESAAGRLIGWSTRADGGFLVRVTSGALTGEEGRRAGPEWRFPYTVRHGRVFVDGTDALPGREQMTQARDYPENWVDIPDGAYAVTVTAIVRGNGAAEDLPDYVVRFGPEAGAAPARRPPDLACWADAEATDRIFDDRPEPPEAPDYGRLYPAFVSANVGGEGEDFSSEGEAPIGAATPPGGDDFALFEVDMIAAASLKPGAHAMLVECHGAGGAPGAPRRYSFRGKRAVRIVAVEGTFANGVHAPEGKAGLFRRKPKPPPATALPAVRIGPLEAAKDAPQTVSPEELQARVIEDLRSGVLGRKFGGIAGYEALRVAAYDEAALLTDWLITHLPLTAEERLTIAALPPNARCATLAERL